MLLCRILVICNKIYLDCKYCLDFPASTGYTGRSSGVNNGVPTRKGEERRFLFHGETERGFHLWATAKRTSFEW